MNDPNILNVVRGMIIKFNGISYTSHKNKNNNQSIKYNYLYFH